MGQSATKFEVYFLAPHTKCSAMKNKLVTHSSIYYYPNIIFLRQIWTRLYKFLQLFAPLVQISHSMKSLNAFYIPRIPMG
jgi:hypothetical protein